MTATVIRRFSSGIYGLIKTIQITESDVASVISEVKREVEKTKNQHCLVIESNDTTKCFYIDIDLTITEKTQKPMGGIWLRQKS